MEIIRKISVTKHSKSRPNSLAYKLTLSAEMVEILGISQDDREVKIINDGNKLIVEKVTNI